MCFAARLFTELCLILAWRTGDVAIGQVAQKSAFALEGAVKANQGDATSHQ